MKTIAIASVVVVLSAGAALAQAGRQTMNFSDQQKAVLDKICAAPAQGAGEDAAKQDESYKAIMVRTLLLSDDQKNALNDYENTQAKAVQDAKARLCDNRPDPASFEASLNFRQRMLEDQLETVKAVNPKLIAFYNSLNQEQKNRFDQMRENAQQMQQQVQQRMGGRVR